MLKSRRTDFSEKGSVRARVISWNVAAKSPSQISNEELLGLLLCNSRDPQCEIIVVGLQEVDMSASAMAKVETASGRLWTQKLTTVLEERGFHLTGSQQLVGLLTLAFVDEKLQKFTHSIEIAARGCGIMGKLGNKGAVALKVELHESSLCFVNCHLAAHLQYLDRRNQDYANLAAQLCFGHTGINQPMTKAGGGEVQQCDTLIWFGDLNYRIGMANEKVRAAISEGNLSELLAADQLQHAIQKGDAFHGFQEVGPINFPPTYKFDKGSTEYDTSEKQRAPAWPDRILKRKADDVSLLCDQSTSAGGYMSHEDIVMSDHRPVTADISIGVLIANGGILFALL